MPETVSDLYTMTWEEAGEAIAASDFVVLPTGSIEQHSTHLPVSVDSIRADYLTAELVDEASEYDLDLLRLPELPFGYSEHHMTFPGTITLSQDTYTKAVIEIGESLKQHGADRLMFVNCHGGNRKPLSAAANRLQRDADLAVHMVHWTSFVGEELKKAFGEEWGHAGDHETSVIELYRPDLVRDQKKEPQNDRSRANTRSYTYFSDVTELGGLGDPTNSDPEKMEEIVEIGTENILEAVVEDLQNGW